MPIQIIDTGSGPLAGNGESIYTAFTKANQNFVEVYDSVSDVYSVIENYDYNRLSNKPTIPTDVSELTDTTDLIVKKTNGMWTVTPGTAEYSFTVEDNNIYYMWVRGNVPNGVISYIATVAVTNSNVALLGTQQACNYTGEGNPILFTSIPNQIMGLMASEGKISTSNLLLDSPSNTFKFGIKNNTDENITIKWGYVKLS